MPEQDLPIEDEFPIEEPDDSQEPEEDGSEYEVIPDDTETDVDGEHPDGDYPQDIYDDDQFDEPSDEPAVPEDEED